MRPSLPILFRKLIAGSLLSLLLLIYAEKAFHTHENTGCSAEAGITQTTLAATCCLCDFQLAKDMELPAQVVVENTIVYAEASFAPVASSIFSLPVDCSANRGPPASGYLVISHHLA